MRRGRLSGASADELPRCVTHPALRAPRGGEAGREAIDYRERRNDARLRDVAAGGARRGETAHFAERGAIEFVRRVALVEVIDEPRQLVRDAHFDGAKARDGD